MPLISDLMIPPHGLFGRAAALSADAPTVRSNAAIAAFGASRVYSPTMSASGSKISVVIPSVGLAGPLKASLAAFERLDPATPDFEVVQNSGAGQISTGLT